MKNFKISTLIEFLTAKKAFFNLHVVSTENTEITLEYPSLVAFDSMAGVETIEIKDESWLVITCKDNLRLQGELKTENNELLHAPSVISEFIALISTEWQLSSLYNGKITMQSGHHSYVWAHYKEFIHAIECEYCEVDIVEVSKHENTRYIVLLARYDRSIMGYGELKYTDDKTQGMVFTDRMEIGA